MEMENGKRKKERRKQILYQEIDILNVWESKSDFCQVLWNLEYTQTHIR